jgi:hypothetical protein
MSSRVQQDWNVVLAVQQQHRDYDVEWTGNTTPEL